MSELKPEDKTLHKLLTKAMKSEDFYDTVLEAAQAKQIVALRDELKKATTERNILAMLSSEKPQFFNPLGIIKAKRLRDRILKGGAG